MRGLSAYAAAACLIGAATAVPVAAQARLWDDPGPCDRECLRGIVDAYLEAMAENDPAAAPLSERVRYTENTELLSIGEGLWENAVSVSAAFRIYVPDPVARQVGFMGVVETGDGAGMLALRLKVDDGRIVEAEHMVANVGQNALGNVETPRPGLVSELPPGDRIPRELMLIIGASYYDSIEQSDGSATLFADDCERRENGMITAGGSGLGRGGQPRAGCFDQMNTRTFTYIDDIDLRRVWIADPVTGLVFGLSQFRHGFETNEFTIVGPDGARSTRTMEFDPFDLPAAHVYKIRDYRIHEIEAMGFSMPYMSGNGWSDFLR